MYCSPIQTLSLPKLRGDSVSDAADSSSSGKESDNGESQSRDSATLFESPHQHAVSRETACYGEHPALVVDSSSSENTESDNNSILRCVSGFNSVSVSERTEDVNSDSVNSVGGLCAGGNVAAAQWI